jgi:hypothetical protein
MGVTYRVLKFITLGDDRLAPGDLIDTSTYGERRWGLMEKRKKIELVLDGVNRNASTVASEPSTKSPSVAPVEVVGGAETSVSAPSPDPEAEESFDYENADRMTLVRRLESIGFSVEDIEGSGANGYVTKNDIRAAIEDIENK